MVDIGSRRELFVDSFLLERIEGEGRRVLHQPIRREVALKTDRPWEGTTAAYVAVMRDEETIRLYYRGDGCTCMAESTDGIHFSRPNLGLYEWEGSKKNNIVYMGPGIHNFTPFKDPNPAACESQRYKAIARTPHGERNALSVFASPDGINWKVLAQHVITDGAFDSQNLAFWDPLREKYIDFHRDFRDGIRDIKTCTSGDFINWTDPVWLDYGDAPAEHLYTNAVIPYFRAPHIYLGFPNRFVPDRKKVDDHAHDGVNDAVFMSSRDGVHFQRWSQAWLHGSTDPKTWTDRNNYVSWGMVPTSASEITMYCNEHYRYQTQRIRRLTIRTDGFVSLYGGPDGAEATTRPLTFNGSCLIINYETSAVGSVQVALCDQSGEPYPGFAFTDCPPIYGNEIAHTVTWEDGPNVGSLAGKPFRLRLRLQDANLYSFQFAPATDPVAQE